jgi:hypothetical protein
MRRSVLSFVFAAGLLAAAGSASAQTTPVAPATPTSPAAPAAAADPANNDDVVSCRYEKTTGSLFARRVCHTQREWHQMNVDARDTIEKLGDDGARKDMSGLGGGQ